MKVFLDSNVLFAAVYSGLKGSYPAIILKLGKENFFDLYISSLVEYEVTHNVQKKASNKLSILRGVLKTINKIPDVDLAIEKIKILPEKDRIILGTAIYYKMDFFITGNTKDFCNFYGTKIQNTYILTPRDFCYNNRG